MDNIKREPTKMSRVKDIIRQNPGRSIEDYGLMYREKFGDHVSPATVYNTLRQENALRFAQIISENYDNIKPIPRDFLKMLLELGEAVGSEKLMRAILLLDKIKDGK